MAPILLKLLPLYVVVVHSLEPTVVAVVVNVITIVPPGSISFAAAPLPAAAFSNSNNVEVCSVKAQFALRSIGPGSFAVMLIPVGVPAPTGIAIRRDPITPINEGFPGLLVRLEIVIEYVPETPIVPTTGSIVAV